MSISNLFFLVLTVFINIVLSFVVYIRNPRSATNNIFAILGLSISIWLIVLHISLQQLPPSLSLIWIRLSIFFATPMSMLFFLLAHTLPSDKIRLKTHHLWMILIINFLVMIVTISNYAFTDIQIVNNSPNPIPGPGLILFGFFVFLTSFGAVLILRNRVIKSIGIERQQLRIIMFGILIMYGLLIGTILIPVALFKSNQYVSLAPIYTLIFLLMTAYAIIRHRFLDIHLIVARSVAYTILLIILALSYVFGLFILATYFTRDPISTPNLLTSAFFALILIFSFQPLRKFLEHITARIFYKQMYSTQTLLWNMSRIMASTLALSDLTEQMLDELLSQMSIRDATLVLTRDNTIIWAKERGNKKNQEYNEKDICEILNKMAKTSREHLLIFDEMYESSEKKIMRDENIAALLALIVEEKVIGAIILSEKSSGDIYSLEDINVLKILAPEISIAVKNSLSYDEIKRFNTTLQEEISSATTEVKMANEQMYKKNLELADRNKTLSLLREIDDIILASATDTKQIAQNVADMIIKGTQIKAILIVLVNQQEKQIFELATAPAAIMKVIDENFGRNLRGITLSLREKDNMIVYSVTKKTMHISDNLYEIMRPIFSKQEADKLQNMLQAPSHVIYPMIVHGTVLGAMVVGLGEPYESISDHQKDLIYRLVSVTGIAIDNALLYEKIADANERLKQLDLLKDEFVSVASHELRTPMTAIKSYLWLALAGKGGQLSEKLHFYLERSFSSTNRLIKLVNDMLNVSRIESGRMSFEMQKVDVVKLADETISEVKPRADELGIHVVLKAESLPSVIADTDKVKEVLINLIGNSLKFTPKGGTITISFVEKDNMVIVNVTDTGEGIDETDIPKLFQKFSLVKGSYQTNKQSSQGTGLGLYICKAIMKEHGGDIWAHSKGHGQGATFSFSMKKYTEKDLQNFQQLAKKEGLGIIHSEL